MFELLSGPQPRFLLKFVEVKLRLTLDQNVHPFPNHFHKKIMWFCNTALHNNACKGRNIGHPHK